MNKIITSAVFAAGLLLTGQASANTVTVTSTNYCGNVSAIAAASLEEAAFTQVSLEDLSIEVEQAYHDRYYSSPDVQDLYKVMARAAFRYLESDIQNLSGRSSMEAMMAVQRMCQAEYVETQQKVAITAESKTLPENSLGAELCRARAGAASYLMEIVVNSGMSLTDAYRDYYPQEDAESWELAYRDLSEAPADFLDQHYHDIGEQYYAICVGS